MSERELEGITEEVTPGSDTLASHYSQPRDGHGATVTNSKANLSPNVLCREETLIFVSCCNNYSLNSTCSVNANLHGSRNHQG